MVQYAFCPKDLFRQGEKARSSYLEKIIGRIEDPVLYKLISAQWKDWLKYTDPSESVEDPLQRASMKELHCVIFLLSEKCKRMSKSFWKFKKFFYHIGIKIPSPKHLYKGTCKQEEFLSKLASYEKDTTWYPEVYRMKQSCFRKSTFAFFLAMRGCSVLPNENAISSILFSIFQIFLPWLVILGWRGAGFGCLLAF